MTPQITRARGAFQSPKGTRDLYQDETLRIRYLQKHWTDTAVRHGFEEIEGPTFESLGLYTLKSGEGIVSELFSFRRQGGNEDYALRPEFTPTVARMYAARAQQLPRPTKWFSAGPYFRAEKPQRGRLREFLQWNCDVIGDDETPTGRAQADADCISCCTGFFDSVGLGPETVTLGINDRTKLDDLLVGEGVRRDRLSEVHTHLDKAAKLPPQVWQARAEELGIPPMVGQMFSRSWKFEGSVEEVAREALRVGGRSLEKVRAVEQSIIAPLYAQGVSEAWCRAMFSVVRGLAYYTGTVFEAIADGERAVAGGGRYDNLVELMGGPPTPAVGFAMGDVVVGLLLCDKGLLPEGPALLEAVSQRPASRRPEVFVLNGGNPDDADTIDPVVRTLVCDLRLGAQSAAHLDRGSDARPWDAGRFDPGTGGVRPLHARSSAKATRNLKKLLADAERQRARLAAVVHAPDRVQLRDLDTRTELTPVDIPGMPRDTAEFCVDPASPVWVGRAAAALLGG